MDFTIDKSKKKEIAKTIINKNKPLRKVYNAAQNAFMYGGVCILYDIVLFMLKRMSLYDTIYSVILAIMIFGLLGFVCRRLTFNFLEENLLERANENVLIQDDQILYKFSIKNQDFSDKTLIQIPISKVDNIDKCYQKIKLTGCFICKQLEVSKGSTKITSEKEINEFIFYDYFEPSLYEHIKKLRNED